MATVTYTKVAQCASGGHVTLQRSGDFSGQRVIHVDEVFNQPLTNDELLMIEVLLLRLHCSGSVGGPSGKTKAELNAEFTAGVTMTI